MSQAPHPSHTAAARPSDTSQTPDPRDHSETNDHQETKDHPETKDQQPKTRFILIGGFLGAGKTTLISRIAQRYLAQGKTVGVITNDQASGLVDTHNLRSLGLDVGEVSGACFCCSFDELVDTAGRLGSGVAPDILLAEPVGSCTDLVATVVLPLQQLWGQQFELAPFGVLLKPSHGQRILSARENASSHDAPSSKRSGFSPQAEYIFRKQLEEADYLMIGRGDQLSESEAAQLQDQLAQIAKDVPTVLISPKTGQGLEAALNLIESPMTAGRRLLDIDYDTYADGEAQLGWVNLSTSLTPSAAIELDSLSSSLVSDIGRAIDANDSHPPNDRQEIAHLKASVIADENQSIANLVSSFSEVEQGLSSKHSTAGLIQVVINARVAMDPEELLKICQDVVHQTASQMQAEVNDIRSQSLRPGRPTPTHRVTNA